MPSWCVRCRDWGKYETHDAHRGPLTEPDVDDADDVTPE